MESDGYFLIKEKEGPAPRILQTVTGTYKKTPGGVLCIYDRIRRLLHTVWKQHSTKQAESWDKFSGVITPRITFF